VRLQDGPIFHFREITPKDFYFAQVLRQAERSQIELILRLLRNEEVLEEATSTYTRAMLKWAAETLLDKSVFTVENWLELAYHLCKQRWDASVDWMEAQPISKINAMVAIVKNHAEKQEQEMKKASRRKK
jgi:hypothetical protein